jgi:hypothetical protein
VILAHKPIFYAAPEKSDKKNPKPNALYDSQILKVAFSRFSITGK